MKKMIAVLLALLLTISVAACSRREEPSESLPEESAAPLPDPATPEGAVAELFESAKEWDLDRVRAHLPGEAAQTAEVPEVLQAPIQQILSRVRYTLGDVETDGQTAAVHLEVTSVDAEKAAADAAAAAGAYIAREKLAGNDPTYGEIVGAAIDGVNIEKLPEKTTATTAHLFLGEDGEWKVDLDNPDNLSLLNAATGGGLDLMEKLQALGESVGLNS